MKKWFEWQQKHQHLDSRKDFFIVENIADQRAMQYKTSSNNVDVLIMEQ